MSFYKKLFFKFLFSEFFVSVYYKYDGNLKLKDLNLTLEESNDIIRFLARKRGVNNYKRKSNDELLHTLKESEKQEKNKNNQQKQTKSKNKERIEVIREKLRELAYKLSKRELKEIKKTFYKVESKKGLLE